MPNFLSELLEYQSRASEAIVNAALECNFEKVNLLQSLLNTANDENLDEDIRLSALTSLINIGELLDAPLGPYFPLSTTYAATQSYTGFHNDLQGLNDGSLYLHATAAEKAFWNSKVSSSDLLFANLTDGPFDNGLLASALNAKQDLLPSGNGILTISGTTVGIDTSVYLTAVTGAAGGDLTGNYPAPTILSTTILNKVLTGFNPSAPEGVVSSSDTILAALQKLNANINGVSAASGTVQSVSLALPTTVFSSAVGPFTTTAALSLSFISQTQNTVFAAPSGSNGVPQFRSLDASDLPLAIGVTPGTYSLATVTVDAYGRVTGVASGSVVGTGTVTSVGISPPSQFTFSGPVTTTGNLSFAWASNPNPNFVFATPDGVAGIPQFRGLVEADIPNLSLSKISGLQSALDARISNSLGTSLIFMGNGSARAAQTTVGGDLSVVFNTINSTNTAVFTIENEAVTYAKFQNIPDSPLNATRPILLGRFSSGQGIMEQLTLSGDFTLDNISGEIGLLTPNPPALIDVGDLLTSTGSNNLVRLSLPSPNDGYLLMPYALATSPACGLIWGEVLGDITYTVDDTTTPGTPFGAFSIGANKVTLGKIQQIASNTILGNNTVNPAIPDELSGTDVTAMLDLFNTTNTDKGLVPGSNGVGGTYFLDADGNWSQPAGSGTINSAAQYSIPYYSTGPSGIALSGLAPQTTNGVYFLRANVTASAAVAPTWIGSTGSGNVVLATSPTLTTPNIGAATATSINGLTITASTGTLTIDNGSTLATSGAFSTTLTATATTTLTLPPLTATLATLALTETLSNKTLLTPEIGDGGTNGHAHFRKSSSAAGKNNYATLFFQEGGGSRRMSVIWDNDGYQSEFEFDAASTTKTYTFPDATGTVALINASNVLNVPKSGSTSGAIALGGGTSGTITFQAPATVTTSQDVYTLPSSYPAAASGYYLTSDLSGGLTWGQIISSGDVTSTATGTPQGNFAVFDDNTGKVINTSSVASLTTGGRATFNDGVDVGVSSSTTGTLVFRNSANAGRTIIRGSTSQAASDINYYWPISQGTTNQVLATDASGNLFWTATGTGNVNTGSVNAFTNSNSFAGTTTFNGTTNTAYGTFRIININNNGYHTFLSNAATSGAFTATFPTGSGVVAYSNIGQFISGANSYTANQTFSNGTLRLVGTNGTDIITFNAVSGSGGVVSLPGGSANFTTTLVGNNVNNIFTGANQFTSGTNTFVQGTLRFLGLNGSDITVLNGTGTGTITLPSLSGNVALLENGQLFTGAKTFTGGVTVNTTALSVASAATFSGALTVSGASASFTVAATATATINPILTLGNSLVGVATQNVFNTVSTTINFGGAATTLNIGTTTSAITGLNIGTGAGASNKTISIGTGSTAGTTTINIGSSSGATNTVAIRGNLTLGTSGGNMGFYGTAAIAKPTNAIAEAAFVANAGGVTVTDDSTFGTYTIQQVVQALKNLGLLT